jgi:hypothetical protein
MNGKILKNQQASGTNPLYKTVGCVGKFQKTFGQFPSLPLLFHPNLLK